MNPRRMRAAIGAFVALGLALLAVLVVLFGGVPTLFTPHYRYTVVLPNAPGVGNGTPVRRSGVRIGQVDTVELDNETGKVRVGILVRTKYTLHADEEPVLNRGLLGDTTIDFMPKPPNGKPAHLEVEPGAELAGRVPPDPQTLLNQATEVLPTTQQALIELGKAADNFNRIAPDLAAATREVGALSRDARDLMPELRRTNDELQVTVKNWGAVGERLNVFLRTNEDKIVKTLDDIDDTVVRIGRAFSDENLRNWNSILKNTQTASERFPRMAENGDELLREARPTLKRLDDTLKDAQMSMGDLRKLTQPWGTSSERINRNLDEGTERFNKVMADVQALMQVINTHDGTAQRLIADPSLYNNLNDIVCQVSKMMPRLERALKDLEVFTDKIARHPESLGVGGAVRPSSGIK